MAHLPRDGMKENDKLKKLLKKVKKENETLKQQLNELEETRKVDDLMKKFVTTRNMDVQTDPRSGYGQHHSSHTLPVRSRTRQTEERSGENEKLNKMLTMHNNLMRRYEKELRHNVEHVETITKLNLRINGLEVQLKEAEMEVHQLKVGKRVSTARSKVRSKSAGHRAAAGRSKARVLDGDSDSEAIGLLDEFNKIRKERDKLKKEKKKLQEEIKGLDVNFFDEVEDLKYALQQSAKLNKEYEKSLRKICTKFGVPLQNHVQHVDRMNGCHFQI